MFGRKKTVKFKLIVGKNEYDILEEVTKDSSGERYATFARKDGRMKLRREYAESKLDIDYETGICIPKSGARPRRSDTPGS